MLEIVPMNLERLPHETAASLANRRSSEREFPRRTSVRIWIDPLWREFQVLDESEGGLGIFSGTEEGLVRGEFVRVICEITGPREAEIRYVAPHPNGGFSVGLKWSSDADHPAG
jgi:hypothetical protein